MQQVAAALQQKEAAVAAMAAHVQALTAYALALEVMLRSVAEREAALADEMDKEAAAEVGTAGQMQMCEMKGEYVGKFKSRNQEH